MIGSRKGNLNENLAVIENGEHKGKAGDGQFLKRGTRREHLRIFV
jgi:hypothetical protein